jgi:hypothetical protein
VDAFLVASASRPAGAPGAVQLAAQPSRRAPSTTVTDSSVSLVPIGCREKYGLAFSILNLNRIAMGARLWHGA